MTTPLSPAQLERLRRDAKKRAREKSITHRAALNELAVERGYRNWDLLAKANKAQPSSTSQPFADVYKQAVRQLGLRKPPSMDDVIQAMKSRCNSYKYRSDEGPGRDDKHSDRPIESRAARLVASHILYAAGTGMRLGTELSVLRHNPPVTASDYLNSSIAMEALQREDSAEQASAIEGETSFACAQIPKLLGHSTESSLHRYSGAHALRLRRSSG